MNGNLLLLLVCSSVYGMHDVRLANQIAYHASNMRSAEWYRPQIEQDDVEGVIAKLDEASGKGIDEASRKGILQKASELLNRIKTDGVAPDLKDKYEQLQKQVQDERDTLQIFTRVDIDHLNCGNVNKTANEAIKALNQKLGTKLKALTVPIDSDTSEMVQEYGEVLQSVRDEVAVTESLIRILEDRINEVNSIHNEYCVRLQTSMNGLQNKMLKEREGQEEQEKRRVKEESKRAKEEGRARKTQEVEAIKQLADLVIDDRVSVDSVIDALKKFVAKRVNAVGAENPIRFDALRVWWEYALDEVVDTLINNGSWIKSFDSVYFRTCIARCVLQAADPNPSAYQLIPRMEEAAGAPRKEEVLSRHLVQLSVQAPSSRAEVTEVLMTYDQRGGMRAVFITDKTELSRCRAVTKYSILQCLRLAYNNDSFDHYFNFAVKYIYGIEHPKSALDMQAVTDFVGQLRKDGHKEAITCINKRHGVTVSNKAARYRMVEYVYACNSEMMEPLASIIAWRHGIRWDLSQATLVT